MKSVELFTGTGGLALGIAIAGFSPVLLADRNGHACATLEHNKDRVPEMASWPSILPTDVSDLEYGPNTWGIDLLAAGAPCQPFSLGGKHRGDEDGRNMFPEVFRAVRETAPRAILIENVKGLLRSSFRPYFDYVLRQLQLPERVHEPNEHWALHDARLAETLECEAWKPDELRYEVRSQVMNVADFGVPQRRERVFIVAFRSDLRTAWKDLHPTHSLDALLYDQYVDGAYWREHELPPPETVPPRFERRISALRDRSRPEEWRWRTVRDALRFLPEPVDHLEDATYPNHLGIPGARSYPGHTGSPWDEPAKTIKAGVHGVPGGENMLRRGDGTVRYFTVRELARLQTFPDSYRFEGPWTECMRQLGNAVPVRIAEHVAQQIRGQLESNAVTPWAR